MSKKIYKDEKSLEQVDAILKFADRSLGTISIVSKDPKSVPPLVGMALGSSLGAAGLGKVGLGLGAAKLGTASFAGGAAIGGVALLPFVAPALVLGGIGYLLFKNKKDKEFHNKKLSRYKEAIKKQNDVIQKYQIMDQERQASESRLKRVNMELREKIDELLAVNEALLKVIDELGNDLQAAS
ncbi:hypothetical protein JCM9140_3933 [Halalkalibacter wakoensis JCM 9140]|uniref:Uncharacterized protein n=1 Tax=Halalkalibacter wakoensis JCM 9140 TaxID=1236970 RepID=W4Q8P3_9BACI|nr:hypothetical protein [Halalkalibacter wakoensis]GAE27774.1 hypothetical protein JCM9140_3933 [Halalkalibacter wakoensis JCM 9140]